jgi:hypothetical protein
VLLVVTVALVIATVILWLGGAFLGELIWLHCQHGCVCRRVGASWKVGGGASIGGPVACILCTWRYWVKKWGRDRLPPSPTPLVCVRRARGGCEAMLDMVSGAPEARSPGLVYTPETFKFPWVVMWFPLVLGPAPKDTLLCRAASRSAQCKKICIFVSTLHETVVRAYVLYIISSVWTLCEHASCFIQQFYMEPFMGQRSNAKHNVQMQAKFALCL